MFAIGWQVLLISRDELPEGYCPSLQISELSVPEMAQLFMFYAHCDLDSEERIAAFTSIAESVGGHTLLLELIGRQIARNYLSLSDAADLARQYGFSHISETRVDYIRDRKYVKATIAAARGSHHSGAQKQLATCLMDKAMSLLDLGMKPKQCGKLLDEAAGIIREISSEYDYERYHWLCITAMFHARVSEDTAKALTLLEEATRIADVARDSTMSYADHLVDQCAPIYYEMGMFGEAIGAIKEAIRLCEENSEIASYRRLRFDASLFLAQVYTDIGDYISAEEIYDLLESCREDSPYAHDKSKPLCPQFVRDKAAEQREKT